ncbi:MAG: hypothetical protein ACI4JW_02410 [Oscillospiraceae bacterium]
MAYRCKTCGYRFKKNDSDLCPECFTARDDIGCTTFEEKHTHGFDASSSEKNSFIEDQLKDEKSSVNSKIEKYAAKENFRKASSSGSANSSYTSGSVNSGTYRSGPFTVKYKTSGQNGGSQGYNYSNNSNNSNKPVEPKVVKIIFLVVIMCFVLPIVISMITAVVSIVSAIKQGVSQSENTEEEMAVVVTEQEEDAVIEETIPLFSGEVEAQIDETIVVSENISYDDILDTQSAYNFIPYFENEEYDKYNNDSWHYLFADCSLEFSSGDYAITEIAIAGISEKSDLIYWCSHSLFGDNASADVNAVTLAVCEDIDEYMFYITVYDVENDTYECGTIARTYSELIGEYE